MDYGDAAAIDPRESNGFPIDNSVMPTIPNPGGSGGNFWNSDPMMSYIENILRGRISDVSKPLDTSWLGDISSQLQGMSGAGGASASPGGDPLGSFRSFVAGFNPSSATSGLTSYNAGRDPNAPVNGLNTSLGAIPNTALPNLQTYMAGRDPNAAANTVRDFMATNNPLASYQASLAPRIAQLRGNPFDDTQLAARRATSFDAMERDRNTEKAKAMEELASRGIDDSSGLVSRVMQQIDQRYDQQRAQGQNALTQEEFALRESHQQQADQLEQGSAAMNLQAAQLSASLTTTIASLQQQGLSMNDAIATSLAQLGLTDRAQQQQVAINVAQLTQQGMAMQDALQTTLAQMGLQAQGMQADVQQNLAGLDVNMRGQDTQLQGAAMNANAVNASSQRGALLSFAQLQNQMQQYNDQRSGSQVDIAMLMDALVRGQLGDLQNTLPQLRGV